MLVPFLAAAMLLQTAGKAPLPPKTRFELSAPLPTIPGVIVDGQTISVGVAAQTAKNLNLQARIMWIDGTANIDRVNDEPKIVALVQQIKAAGFNTIVFDVKPISGQVLYNSKIAPKIAEWRGKVLPAEFDPLTVMSREAKVNGLSIFASLNAFSEGHSLFRVGPGYAKKDWQTVIYDPEPVVASTAGAAYPLSMPFNKLPDELGSLAMFNDIKKLPSPKEGLFAVTLTRQGVVVDGFEGGGIGNGVPSVPAGGSILLGSGGGAAFLKVNANPGNKLLISTRAKFEPISEHPEQQYPLIVNPNNPEVQDYELGIAREVVTNYPVDGIIYDDRFRYGGLNADFSDITRAKFERFVGKQLNWPDDVFHFTINPNLAKGIIPGPYYDTWMAWRAFQLKEFMWHARQVIRQARPNAQLGLYAGSWYGEYSALGNNWASPSFDAGFWFLTPEYKKSGMSSIIDFLITGCYYPTATISEALSKGISIGNTIESAGTLSNRAVRDETWAYAGIALDQFKNNPEGLRNALQAACASTQGVMVFDLSHDIEPMWPVFTEAFAQPKKAPHQVAKLLNQVRQTRAQLDKRGAKESTVVIAAGSSGTGQ